MNIQFYLKSINQSFNEWTTNNNTLQEKSTNEQLQTFYFGDTLVVGDYFEDMIITSDSENNDDFSDKEIEI